ncbi:MAG: SAM-dependent methyltransferase [Actinophytocola sp.]|uniref:SAM-dependent methyltransferase n=1 Tax=Actinophytocola sp. TaxID=1872138 RepID=UPI003C7963FA
MTRSDGKRQVNGSLSPIADKLRPTWAPEDVDIARPSAARVYDYWLGGCHNFGTDREFAEEVDKVIPAREFARANRAFLRRVVRFLVREAGVRQFLDLGSGLPTVGNVHEIAQGLEPDSTVLYVDFEPVAVTHNRLVLEDTPRAEAIWADLRDPDAVLQHPDTRQLIDFTQPVAVLLCAVLHFVGDEDVPSRIVANYRDALCPGSYVAISHATADDYPDDLAKAVEMYQTTATPATLRRRDEITGLFDGLALVSPGVVFTPQWHPEGPSGADPRRSLCYGGLAVL